MLCSPNADTGGCCNSYKNADSKSYRNLRQTLMPQTGEHFYLELDENTRNNGRHRPADCLSHQHALEIWDTGPIRNFEILTKCLCSQEEVVVAPRLLSNFAALNRAVGNGKRATGTETR